MARQYWLLISIWSICIAIVVLGIAAPSTNHALLGMPFLITPILSIVTLVRVWKRDSEEVIGPKAKILHRVVIGACVLFAIGGIVGSAAQLATVDGETRTKMRAMAMSRVAELLRMTPARNDEERARAEVLEWRHVADDERGRPALEH